MASFETQSNIQPRDIFTATASGTLSAATIVKTHTDGTIKPTAADNDTTLLHLCLEDAVSGDAVALCRLHPGTEVRIKAGTVSGTQNAGVAVYLKAAGTINEVSTTSTKIGYALEQFVTGQLVRVQPISQP